MSLPSCVRCFLNAILMMSLVRGLVLSTLGLLSELYPTLMHAHARNLASQYMRTLEGVLASDKEERQLTAGVSRSLLLHCIALHCCIAQPGALVARSA